MASMTVDKLKERYEGDLTVRFSDTYLQVKIEDAEELIAGDHPTVAGRLASGVLSQNNYQRIVAAIVFRVIRNPDGLTSESEGGVSVGRNLNVASGDMWITDKEIATLTGVKPSASRSLPGTASIGVDAGWAS